MASVGKEKPSDGCGVGVDWSKGAGEVIGG